MAPATIISASLPLLRLMTVAALLASFLSNFEVRHLPTSILIISHILVFAVLSPLFFKASHAKFFVGLVLFSVSLYLADITRYMAVRYYDSATRSGRVYVDSVSEDTILLAIYFLMNAILGIVISLSLYALFCVYVAAFTSEHDSSVS